MSQQAVMRPAQPEDAASVATLAEAKRAEYAQYSPVFWRPATDARARHEPFLRSCIASGDYLSLTAERGDAVAGAILGKLGAAPPPFQHDVEATCFVDDFFVAQLTGWATDGATLLAALTERARAAGAVRMIVVSAQRDQPKRSMLLDVGFTLAASWWTLAITPLSADRHEMGDIEAVVAPAPRVYDPGGPVALALALGSQPAANVAQFAAWAASSGAVLAVVPARAADMPLAESLLRHGYAVASEWYLRAL